MSRDRFICSIAAFIMVLTGAASFPSFRFGFTGLSPSDFRELVRLIVLSDPQKLKDYLETYIPVFSAVFIFTLIIALIFTAVRIFIGSALYVGGCRYFLKLGKCEATGIAELTGNFKDGNYRNIFLINLFAFIRITLCTLLFIIPGIIKALEYFPVNYLLATRPDMDSHTAFSMSKKLMSGKKTELFVFYLTFIGWDLLSIITFGIVGIVFVYPYKQAAFAEFFAEIRKDAVRNGVITDSELPEYGSPFAPQQEFGGSYGFGGTYQGNIYDSHKKRYDATSSKTYGSYPSDSRQSGKAYDPFGYYDDIRKNFSETSGQPHNGADPHDGGNKTDPS